MKNIRNMQIVIVMTLCFITLIFTMAFFWRSNQIIQVTAESISKKWNTSIKDVSFVVIGNSSYKIPTIKKNALKSFQVVLKEPGDKVHLRFRIVNNGDLSCIISEIKEKIHCDKNSLALNEEVCNSLKYTLTYEDGVSVNVGDVLPDDSSKSVKLTIEYPMDSSNLIGSSIVVQGDYLGFVYKDK